MSKTLLIIFDDLPPKIKEAITELEFPSRHYTIKIPTFYNVNLLYYLKLLKEKNLLTPEIEAEAMPLLYGEKDNDQ